MHRARRAGLRCKGIASEYPRDFVPTPRNDGAPNTAGTQVPSAFTFGWASGKKQLRVFFQLREAALDEVASGLFVDIEDDTNLFEG